MHETTQRKRALRRRPLSAAAAAATTVTEGSGGALGDLASVTEMLDFLAQNRLAGVRVELSDEDDGDVEEEEEEEEEVTHHRPESERTADEPAAVPLPAEEHAAEGEAKTNRKRRRPERVRERDRAFAKRVYYETLRTLEELQDEVARLEVEVNELLATHSDEAVTPAAAAPPNHAERQQLRDRYVALVRDRCELEAANAALEAQVARMEKLEKLAVQLAGAELRATERAQQEWEARGARPPGKGEYREITSEYCAQVTDRAYKRVLAYRERSPSSYTWGAELFGWKDFRSVEQSCITYSLEKIFLFQRAEAMTQQYWDLVTSERASEQVYSPSLKVRFHILQHVDANNIVIYRTIDRPAGENGLEQRMRTFVLTSRVRLEDGKGWAIFTCAIDPARVLVAAPKGRTRLEPVREEMWMDNLKWLVCEPMGANGEHSKLVFGGVLDSVATANPSQWILEELMVGIRYERGGSGPFNILFDD